MCTSGRRLRPPQERWGILSAPYTCSRMPPGPQLSHLCTEHGGDVFLNMQLAVTWGMAQVHSLRRHYCLVSSA